MKFFKRLLSSLGKAEAEGKDQGKIGTALKIFKPDTLSPDTLSRRTGSLLSSKEGSPHSIFKD